MRLSRVRCIAGLLALALPALIVGGSGTAHAQAKKSDAVVKAAATASKADADGKQTVTITLDIDKSWHLYANPAENEDVASAQTEVSVVSRVKPEEVKIEYPVGKLHKDKFGSYRVYEGKIAIKAHVKRAKGDNGPLEVSIKLQACDARTCLIPATVKLSVP